MEIQTVKTAILRPALRAVQQETGMSEAEDEDYNDAFNFFIEMLEFWQARDSVELWSTPPPSMNAGVSTEDPTFTMWTNLVLQISSYFAYNPTLKQSTDATRSFRLMLNRQKHPALMNCPANMPRGTGNTYWRRWVCFDECLDVVNTAGAKVVTAQPINT